jgi:cytochrome c oxidase assembly factor CtaG
MWRLAAFLGGAFALWVAMGSRLASMDHQLLTMHMLQHLLLMTIAAPLILLGMGKLRFRPHPVFCWLVSTAVVIGWHVPVLFTLGMEWHGVEHASFFVAGLLFWWPVIQVWQSWSVPLYLFLATLPCDALSAFLTFCGRVVYPHYLNAPRVFDISPLADQESAGALMWVWVTFAYLIPAAVVTVQMLSPQRRTSKVAFLSSS